MDYEDAQVGTLGNKFKGRTFLKKKTGLVYLGFIRHSMFMSLITEHIQRLFL